MDPRAYLEENRRRFDVVAERTVTQMPLVAEGVTTLSERLDRVEATCATRSCDSVTRPR